MKKTLALLVSVALMIAFIPSIGLSALAENGETYTAVFYEDSTKEKELYRREGIEGSLVQIQFDVTKEGHSFVNWINAETGEKVELVNGNTLTMPAKNSEYYAQWKTNSYKLLYIGYSKDSASENVFSQNLS